MKLRILIDNVFEISKQPTNKEELINVNNKSNQCHDQGSNNTFFFENLI